MSILFIEKAVTDWHLPFQRNAVFDYLSVFMNLFLFGLTAVKLLPGNFLVSSLLCFQLYFP